MKISKSQLKAIIKEEALKFKRAVELKKELAEIEKQLNEVKAGEVMATDGVHAGQKKAIFTSKGNSNLKMEDGDIESDEVDIDVPVDGIEDVDADVTVDADIDSVAGDTISKEAVKNAIEALEAQLGISEPGEEVEAGTSDEEGDEEFEFDASEIGDEAGEESGEEAETETDEEGEEEIEEYGDEHQVATKDAVQSMPVGEDESSEEETVKENLDEPIEGNSVAQVAKDSSVDDGMEKDKHVKEGAEIQETIAEAEKKRMAFLAGILKG